MATGTGKARWQRLPGTDGGARGAHKALDLPGGQGGQGTEFRCVRSAGYLPPTGLPHEGALWGRRQGPKEGLLLPALAL